MGTMMIILDLEYEIEKLGDLVDIQRPKRETHETEVPRKKKIRHDSVYRADD